MQRVFVKRVYEPADPSDGFRVLVDRLWPRGLKKVDAAVDFWPKAIAPSTELRKWFHADPERFGEFAKKYGAALQQSRAQVLEILERAEGRDVCLLYGSRDEVRNHAHLVRDFLLTNR